MKFHRFIIRLLLLTAPLLPLPFLTGCSDEEISAVQTDKDKSDGTMGDFYLALTLSRGEISPGRATRSDYGDPLRPGVDTEEAQENRINTLHIFFESKESATADANGSGEKKVVRYDVPANASSHIEVPVPSLAIPYGAQNIYIGVNLTDEEEAHFAKGNTAYEIPQSYKALNYDLTEAFAPGRGIGLDAPRNNHNTRRDIAMFCTEGQEVYLEKNKKIYQCDSAFILKRNVAKVLTTCKVAYTGGLSANSGQESTGGEDGVGYAPLVGTMLYPEDHELAGQARGWIRQSSVKFLVNSLNYQSFLLQKQEWNTDLQTFERKDPNYTGLDHYIVYDEKDQEPMPGNWDGEFLYTSVQQRSDFADFYVKTLPYDERRLRDGSSDHYYEGLYCPENTFTILATTIDGEDVPGLTRENHNILLNYYYPWPMITHVSIVATFTPRELYVDKAMIDYIDTDQTLDTSMKALIKNLLTGEKARPMPGFEEQILIIDSPSEAVSQAILTASLRHNYAVQEGTYKPEVRGCPANTYLSITDQDENQTQRFYTYGAARIIAIYAGWKDDGTVETQKKLSAFNLMPHGEGYFFTYIDNRQNADPDKAETPLTYANGQVERNVYYILTIDAFSQPGNSPHAPRYVKVHTRTHEWKPGGSGEVILK